MPSGGKRTGSGRPKGSGRFQEPTVAIRVPKSKLPRIKNWIDTAFLPPLFLSSVAAGFPSPAENAIDKTLDLHEHLVKNPAATFFVKASGSSMINAGIHDGDLLIVDRSLPALDGKIVIVALNGELTVKRLSCKNKTIELLPENPSYTPIPITDTAELHIFGVVTAVIHPL